jgi:hypothetical protein
VTRGLVGGGTVKVPFGQFVDGLGDRGQGLQIIGGG